MELSRRITRETILAGVRGWGMGIGDHPFGVQRLAFYVSVRVSVQNKSSERYTLNVKR